MAEPLLAIVRVARTPDQAQMFAALLRGAGIPAHVDFEGLADEFVTTQRLMNLSGVRVLVPTASLEHAREVLGDVDIDPVELERQALAAGDPEPAPSDDGD
ncbi:MAG: hypothetical protein KF830_05450 [Planctomycetes bacterium]|nr:hypothetical protein [Planctomycetota bacterium]